MSEYLRDHAQDEPEDHEEFVLTYGEYRKLKQNNMELKTSLQNLLTWIVNGIPDSPNHVCGPESDCDCLCVKYKHFCDDLYDAHKILAGGE